MLNVRNVFISHTYLFLWTFQVMRLFTNEKIHTLTVKKTETPLKLVMKLYSKQFDHCTYARFDHYFFYRRGVWRGDNFTTTRRSTKKKEDAFINLVKMGITTIKDSFFLSEANLPKSQESSGFEYMPVPCVFPYLFGFFFSFGTYTELSRWGPLICLGKNLYAVIRLI